MCASERGIVSRIRVPGAYGRSFEAAKGWYIAVVDVEGGQGLDFWALDADDFGHYLSPPFTMVHIGSLQPKVGDQLVTNRRDPILTIVADDVGWHDMMFPACDKQRYLLHFGVTGHRNCHDNFLEAMEKYNWGSRLVPNPPFNIFMNTTVEADGTVIVGEQRSKPGDSIILRAEMNIVGVGSACPFDLAPTGRRSITDIDIIVAENLDTLQKALG